MSCRVVLMDTLSFQVYVFLSATSLSSLHQHNLGDLKHCLPSGCVHPLLLFLVYHP